MNNLGSSVYVKKWIIEFIVHKLILIYFTWFVYNFVSYKYSDLKRSNVCLMPLSTCVCVCVCVCDSRPFTMKALSIGTVGISEKRSTMLR